MLSDTYKWHSGIKWTDDIKKAGLSMAAVMLVSPIQANSEQPVTNRYVPRINELTAEAAACSILKRPTFVDRAFESKLHFYNSLRLLTQFDCLKEFVGDLEAGRTADEYEIGFSHSDHYKISDAIQKAEMISNFRV